MVVLCLPASAKTICGYVELKPFVCVSFVNEDQNIGGWLRSLFTYP